MDVKQNAHNRTYSKEFKLKVVRLKLEHGYSKYRLVREFGITRAMVERWVKRYQSEGERGLEDKRGRTPKVAKPKSYVEELEARVRYLEMENAILKKLEEIERRDVDKK